MTEKNTIIKVTITVGEVQSGMYLAELLRENTMRKFGSFYYHTVKLNGKETDDMFTRTQAGDTIELFGKTDF
jgi:hypothetical protein